MGGWEGGEGFKQLEPPQLTLLPPAGGPGATHHHGLPEILIHGGSSERGEVDAVEGRLVPWGGDMHTQG